ncbi:glycoside hydrolase family 88 protein [Erythrobacter sp.]|uniref:glycoside hydrolase family 88 protein n=1 Tax=Erythrobacter sp. TaxID=1042 RepID=UPI001B00F9D3|nr:glycoside hydrolase family 88 protein [Erythrobacter sp.]MBO6526348.1 glycoside hydrolase family 88 protein [Erythrobacter sp.]MBO6530601.1 glycoside hydrolase family 88 protein [Erythrobacter sp.]
MKFFRLRRGGATRVTFVNVSPEDLDAFGAVRIEGLHQEQFVRDARGNVPVSQLYPVENAVPVGTNKHLAQSFRQSKIDRGAVSTQHFAPGLWRTFIENAAIPDGYRNAGLKYAGYVGTQRESWCLPSWIWTNAAIVRFFCNAGEFEEAVRIADILLAKQEETGGWIVRSDYAPNDEIPVLAPNDSAYIANNALLPMYRTTGDEKYLDAATKCANWIRKSARPDGLVWTGRNERTGEWLEKYTIVDTGFTAGLFAELYMLTKNERCKMFLERFVQRFLELFYNPEARLFATSVDFNGKQNGGHFARGQAWALEGLIPAYKALGAAEIEEVVEAIVRSLLQAQLANGGWAYNLSRPYYGEDCKGVPVIAKALTEWSVLRSNDRLKQSAALALQWCEDHTRLRGPAVGGIFSYNLEGAVVHNLYTSTAFVYSSAYALETRLMVQAHD